MKSLPIFCALASAAMINSVLAQHDVSLPHETTAVRGSTLTLPLQLTFGVNPPNPAIQAYGLKLEFPHRQLQFDSTMNQGTLTQGWIISRGQLLSDSVVNIGGFGLTAITASGVLINARFTVRAEAEGQDTLRLYDFLDNLAGSTTTDAVLRISLTPFVSDPGRNDLPGEFKLFQNYPNPFNPQTQISYQLPRKSHVTLKVYDLSGKELLTLVDEEKAPGSYTANFDGAGWASGVYLYRLRAGDLMQAGKMVLLR